MRVMGYDNDMDTATRKLLEGALELPDWQRAELAAELIVSLDRELDEDAVAAWDAEIAQRVAELDEGAVATVSWSEARTKIMGRADGSTAD